MSDVLVVGSRRVRQLGIQCGVYATTVSRLNQLLLEAEFIDRDAAEHNKNYRQLIPYVVVYTPDGHVLSYKRGGGERRLLDMYSIGIGGHVEPCDVSMAGGMATLFKAARRELREEIGLGGDFDLDYIGTINDDNTEVGAVHLGVCMEVRVNNFNVIGSGEIASPEFIYPADLQGKVEGWSELLLEYYA